MPDNSMMKRFRSKEIIFSVLFTFISLVITLFILEFFMRLLLGEKPGNKGRLFKTSISRFPLGSQENDGYSSVFLKNNSPVIGGVEVYINNLGLRDYKARRKTKPERIKRIAIFGDSFAFGQGNKDRETFPAQLEKILHTKNVEFKNLEVLNFGVPGFNTIQEFIYLKRFGIQFKPDVVLLQWLFNDVESNNYNARELDKIINDKILIKKAKKELFVNADGWAQNKGFWANVNLWAKKRSVFYAWTVPRLKEFAAKYFNLYIGFNDALYTNHDLPGAQLSLKSILCMSNYCKDNKIKFGVIIYPALSKLTIQYYNENIYSGIERFCRKNGIPVLNLFESTFEGMSCGDLWVSRIDVHPNAQAQKLAALEIAKWVVGMSDSYNVKRASKSNSPANPDFASLAGKKLPMPGL
jgi:lysophospholipase L1-like esterase